MASASFVISEQSRFHCERPLYLLDLGRQARRYIRRDMRFGFRDSV